MTLNTYKDVIAARNKIKSYTDKISELQSEIREYYVNKNKKSLERDEKLQEIAALTFLNISHDFLEQNKSSYYHSTNFLIPNTP